MNLNPSEIEGWIEAFYFLQMMRLLHQYQCTVQNKEMNNKINPENLNELDRRILKEAFRQSRKMQSHLATAYRL
jgi:CBS domain-containing protein